jgi:VanZ family protein
LTARNYTRGLVRWIPPILWTAVILSLSSDLFSARHTVEWLGSLNFLGRKAAHLTEYFILGALLFRALRGDAHGFRARWAVIAVVLAAGVASFDEWHQSFVP